MKQYPFSWTAALWYFGAYLIAITLAVPTFSWPGLWCAIVLHILAGGGITLGVHRYFSHRTFVAPRWVDWVLGILYILSFDRAGQGLISWVVQHHAHHRHTDEDNDPHSPRHGFWWAWAGHHLWRNPKHWDPKEYLPNAPARLRNDKLLVWLDRPSTMWGFQGLLILTLAVTGYVSGGVSFAASLVVWGVFVRFVITQTLHSAQDTLNHGSPWPFRHLPDTCQTGSHAKNNYLMWLPQLGNETHHNVHHAFPRAANNGGSLWRFWRWDADSLIMKLAETIGLVHGCQWLSMEEIQPTTKSSPKSGEANNGE